MLTKQLCVVLFGVHLGKYVWSSITIRCQCKSTLDESSSKQVVVCLLFLFTYESLAIIFYSEHVKMREITVKPLKIIKHTFRNTTYDKAIRFRFTMQYIILMAWKMAEAD